MVRRGVPEREPGGRCAEEHLGGDAAQFRRIAPQCFGFDDGDFFTCRQFFRRRGPAGASRR